jgi:hypothetical protein
LSPEVKKDAVRPGCLREGAVNGAKSGAKKRKKEDA